MAVCPVARPETDIEAELWFAIKAGRRVDMLEAFGVAPANATIGGASFVQFASGNYMPDPGGQAAVIVGVVEDAGLVDLAAFDLEGEHIGTRLGIGTILGMAAVEATTDLGPLYDPVPLRLVTPKQW